LYPLPKKKVLRFVLIFFLILLRFFFILFIYIFWHKMRHLSRFIVFIQYIIYFSFYLLNKEKEIIDSWHTITCLNLFFYEKNWYLLQAKISRQYHECLFTNYYYNHFLLVFHPTSMCSINIEFWLVTFYLCVKIPFTINSNTLLQNTSQYFFKK
jgi:hypothetical protein